MNLNKSRFKKCDRVCLNIVGNCLYYFAVVTAPVAPFMAEAIFIELHKISRVWFDVIEYANFDTHSLQDQRIDLSSEIDYYNGVTNPHSSIHYHPFPKFEKQSSKESVSLVSAFDYFADLIDLTRMVRAKREHPSEVDVITGKPKKASSIKLSLRKIYVASFDNNVLEQLKKIEGYIMKELNVDSIVYTNDIAQFVTFKITPNIPLLKQRVTDGKVLGKIINYLKVYFSNASNINDVIANKSDITVPISDDVSVTVSYDDLQITNEPVANLDKNTSVLCSKQTGLTVVFDTIVTEELLDRYYCKLFYRAYQDARKKGGFVQTDSIHLQFMCSDNMFALLKKYNVVGDKSSSIPSAERLTNDVDSDEDQFEKHITLNAESPPMRVEVDIEFDVVTLVLMKLS
jgi:isoleucyl-tRNA synthetase